MVRPIKYPNISTHPLRLDTPNKKMKRNKRMTEKKK